MSSRKFIYKNSNLFDNNAKGKKTGRNFKKIFRPKLELLPVRSDLQRVNQKRLPDNCPDRLTPDDLLLARIDSGL
jgi:hypothetical protein